MKSLSVTFLALLGLSVLTVSCGDDTAKKLSSSNSKTTQFLESTKTAVTNIAQSLENITTSASCTTVGTPTAGSLSDAYNKAAFPCSLKTDTKDFNTPKGIMSIFSGLMCAIENQVDFNYATSVTTHTVSVDRLDSCLSGLSFTNTSAFTVVVKEQSLTNNASWTYKITIDFSNDAGMSLTYAGKQLVIYLREAGTETAAKVSIGTVGSTNYLGMAIQESTTNNTLRLDMMAEMKHYRLLVEGSSSDFVGINSLRGAHSISNGQGVVSIYAAGSSFQYQDTSGGCFPNAACGQAMTPTLDFSTFSDLSGLSSFFTNDSSGLLLFTDARAAQFLP